MAARAADGGFTAERLLDDLGEAVIATDLPGVVVYWNAAAERLYGWSTAEAVGRNIATLTVPQVSQALGAEIMQLLRSGRPWSGSFTVRRKDGSTFPALVTDSGVYDDARQLVGIVGVSTDLGQALRPLLARSADAALLLTGDAKIAFASPAATRWFGWTDRTVLGAPLWELIHRQDRPVALEHHRRAVATNEPVPPVECRVRRADGSWCWVDLQLTNSLDDPAVRGLVCNLRDITQRRHERDQLVRLTEQLQTALTSRVVIEQAKGVLAERMGIDLDSAFALIRRSARDSNEKLHDVAQRVVSGGSLGLSS